MDKKTRILIGDEEPLTLDFFEVMFTNLGFEIIKAADGQEALEKILAGKPDLIVLDNVLPKLSGWKVTRLLKTGEEYRACRDIPIIMFSALDDVKDKVEGFELGVEDYITKPFNFSEVLARIRAVLKHRKLAQQAELDRERLALLETLNESYRAFGEDLRERFSELEAAWDARGPSGSGELWDRFSGLKDFTFKTLEILSREREAIKRTGESSRLEDSLSALEERFRQHLESLKEEAGEPESFAGGEGK